MARILKISHGFMDSQERAFFSFSTQNHAESSRNFVKYSILKPTSYVTHFSQKTVAGDIHTAVFDGSNAFFTFLAEICLRTPLKSLQHQVLDPKRANSVPPAPCLKLQSAVFATGTAFVNGSDPCNVLFSIFSVSLQTVPHLPIHEPAKPVLLENAHNS